MKIRILGVLLLMLGLTVGAAQQSSSGSLRTESYGIFPVEGSGVSGNLNVIERVDGGVEFVVTLVGIQEGSQYLPAIFEGTCGPDRERLLLLPAVGSMQGDPFVSWFDTSEVNFSQVVEGDYFIYIYDGATDEGDVIACGEVGVGANR